MASPGIGKLALAELARLQLLRLYAELLSRPGMGMSGGIVLILHRSLPGPFPRPFDEG